MNDTTDRYADIIGLPHHRSEVYPPMPRQNRAAQFSPFAALRGYEEKIEEENRVYDERLEPAEAILSELDAALAEIKARLPSRPRVRVVFFAAEGERGGAYRTAEVRVKGIDGIGRRLLLAEGGSLPLDDIYALEPLGE